MSDYIRRLPVYLLIDCSGSMHGEKIEAVKQGIRTLVSELKGDPQALETAYISVITFASAARQEAPLTELMLFREPELKASGATMFGRAVEVLIDCMNTEIRHSTQTQKGDWRPLVFILTDGSPSDAEDFKVNASRLKAMKAANIVACAAGADAKTEYLKMLTDNVLMMNSLTAGDFAQFFAWVSGSVRMTSKSIEAKPGELMLPPPPHGFQIVP
ncbi:MAG: VWA domain-containing protein [Oscillospiraceae bacterium]|nr:VWA domain-containing protein [Oscillospiraceae bacterium]